MVNVALYVPLEAKPGKEAELEQFLRDGQALAEQEPGTTAWFALRMGPTTFAIFDAFPDDDARQSHLNGRDRRRAHGEGRRPPRDASVDQLARRDCEQAAQLTRGRDRYASNGRPVARSMASGILNTRSAFSRRNFGHTWSRKGTFGRSANWRSSVSPAGK